MLFVIGMVIVFGSIAGGYMPHGKIEVLWQPLEFLIIFGCAVGGYIIANPKDVLGATMGDIMGALRGSPHNKKTYLELLTVLYSILRLAKNKGPLALEGHVENPEKSTIFNAFPAFAKNHHAVTFLCDYLRMITMGSSNAFEIEALLDEELETHHAETGRVANAITIMADGLPAFGIVAAVLGVITTMGSILEPPEVLGALIGAALVGTFLGVLLAYGIFGPLGQSIKTYVDCDAVYFTVIKAALVAHMQGYAPSLSIEFARKMLFSNLRPTFIELEEAIVEAPTGE